MTIISRTAPKLDTIKNIVKRFEENGTIVVDAAMPCRQISTEHSL